MIEPGLEVTYEQDDTTGRWTAPCPLCAAVIRCWTEHGTNEALTRHMNEQHYESRRGHA